MNHLEILPKTTVTIDAQQQHLGSGILLKKNSEFYIFTAAHVVFGDNCCNFDKIDLKDLNYDSEQFGRLTYLSHVGSKQIYLCHDIIAIKVKAVIENIRFPEINFCSDIGFPELEFAFRGKAKSSSNNIYTVMPCTINGVTQNNNINLKIPSDFYNDFKGESGAEVLEGYSGSGVFINAPTGTPNLVAIVGSVTDDVFNGVNCIPITKFKDHLFPDLTLSDFFGGDGIIKLQVAEHKRRITQAMIDDKKTNGYGVVENLTKKMDSFIENWTTEDLDDFVMLDLLWENIYRHRIRNNHSLRSLVDESKAELSIGNLKFHVKSIQEGNEKFHKTQDGFIEIVKSHLEDSPLKKNYRLIATGEIARLLSNCKLDIKL